MWELRITQNTCSTYVRHHQSQRQDREKEPPTRNKQAHKRTIQATYHPSPVVFNSCGNIRHHGLRFLGRSLLESLPILLGWRWRWRGETRRVAHICVPLTVRQPFRYHSFVLFLNCIAVQHRSSQILDQGSHRCFEEVQLTFPSTCYRSPCSPYPPSKELSSPCFQVPWSITHAAECHGIRRHRSSKIFSLLHLKSQYGQVVPSSHCLHSQNDRISQWKM